MSVFVLALTQTTRVCDVPRHEMCCDVLVNGKKFLNARRTIPRDFNSFPPHSRSHAEPKGSIPADQDELQFTNTEGEQLETHNKMVLSFILIQNRQCVQDLPRPSFPLANLTRLQRQDPPSQMVQPLQRRREDQAQG